MEKSNSISKSKIILVVTIVSLGWFMTSLDATVVNVALPVIQTYFHESMSMTEWVITSYLLVISSVLLSFGRLSDLIGHKKIILIGFFAFTLGSASCGLSISLYMLIISRIIQALGGAMIMTTGPAIIMDVVPVAIKGKALSSTAISVAIAACAGPVVGGIFTSNYGWRSIFFINIPIGVIAFILAVIYTPLDCIINKSVPFDICGSIMAFIALVLIILPLNMIGKSNVNFVLTFIMFITGIFIMIEFVLWEIKSPNPLLKISLFKNRAFITSNLALFCAFLMEYALLFILPYFLEKYWMLSPSIAGEALLPLTVAMICITPVSGILTDQFDSGLICTSSMILTSISAFMLCGLNAKRSMVYWVVILIIGGIGAGLFQTPNMKEIMDSVSKENRGMASGMRSTMVFVGETLGVVISETIYSFCINLNKKASYAFHVVFITLGLIALLAAIISFKKGTVVEDLK